MKPQHSALTSNKPPRHAQLLVEAARDLARTVAEGNPPQVLRGRHIALLGEGDDHPACEAFITAATGLGARVTRVRLLELRTTEAQWDQKTASLLGHLYDAIVCIGCNADLVAWIERHAGIPVCNQPLSTGVDEEEGGRSPVDGRYLLLAQLMNRLA